MKSHCKYLIYVHTNFDDRNNWLGLLLWRHKMLKGLLSSMHTDFHVVLQLQWELVHSFVSAINCLPPGFSALTPLGPSVKMSCQKMSNTLLFAIKGTLSDLRTPATTCFATTQVRFRKRRDQMPRRAPSKLYIVREPTLRSDDEKEYLSTAYTHYRTKLKSVL